jgi:hypothetical protein
MYKAKFLFGSRARKRAGRTGTSPVPTIWVHPVPATEPDVVLVAD